MSLLLQALQKAARNREGQSAGADGDTGGGADADRPLAPAEAVDRYAQPGDAAHDIEPEADAAARTAPDMEELSLAEEEELFGSDAAMTGREPTLNLAGDDAAPRRPAPRAMREPAGVTQAATIVRASESKSAGLLDWVRDRPVHAFAVAGGIFGVFYGAYVYLQIFHPAVLRGDFLRRPALQAKSPPPALPVTPPDPAASPASPPDPAVGTVAVVAPPAIGTVAAAPGQGKMLPAQPSAQTAPAPRPPVAVSSDDFGASEEAEPPARKPARARRPARSTGQDEVENVVLDDVVSVRSAESRPPPALGTLNRAWEALQQGRHDEAQAMYEEVAAAEPGNVDAQLGLGVLAAARGNTEQAARHYGRALELEPRNTTAQAGLISIIGQADPQLSESRLKQLIATEPSGFMYFALGNLYAKQSLWAKAQLAYFQAYQLQPDHPDYAYNLAVGLEHLGQSRIALNYYRRALELRSVRGRAEFDQTRVEERIGQLTARVGSQ
jgi:Flp pilus assembly protein TadD